jgi:hypothetical protein
METGTKSSLRAADRLGQTLAALARLLDQMMNDVQAVSSEFRERIQQTAQDTETAVQELADERLKAAVDEAVRETERNTRAQVSEELHSRSKQETASAVAAVRKELTAECDRLKEEIDRLKEELDLLRQATVEWDKERTRLLADHKRANDLLEQTRNEHDRALAESDEAAAIALELQVSTAADRVRQELTARFNLEREQLIAERDRANKSLAEQNTEYQQMVASSEEAAESHKKSLAAAQQQWDSERAKMAAEAQKAQQKAAEKPAAATEAVAKEVGRVEGLIKEISEVIEDPSTELSVVIRKNAERAELESYLRGVRFSIQGR